MQRAAVQPTKVKTNRKGAPDDGRMPESSDKIDELVIVCRR